MVHIGKCLKAYRQKNDIPLRKFAKEVGVSNGILCQIENSKPMGANTMLLIMDWLFGHGKASHPRKVKES